MSNRQIDSPQRVRFLLGLRNPGASYEGTRHNAGADFAQALAAASGAVFSNDAQLKSEWADLGVAKIALPCAWMNESGQAAALWARKRGMQACELAVAHDDVELEPGQVRLRFGGGFGGHNGLRSIGQALGTPDYWRIRIGVGHPQKHGKGKSVADWSLSKPSPDHRLLIEEAMRKAQACAGFLFEGDIASAMALCGAPVQGKSAAKGPVGKS